MPEFSIESNGRIEKTAVYYNGEQLAGVREVFINIDEQGAFDAVVQYLGEDGQLYTKQIFTDYFEHVRMREPSFDEDEARSLHLLMISSEGDLNDTVVYRDGEEQFGIVSLLVHMKPTSNTSSGIRGWFGGRNDIADTTEFKALITYRNDDDTLSTEGIF
ncbi:MAG: hypothetical protein FGM24_01670 [Candidatus Kapabacteria bacterium]|nr:hypothetical protein [Candidatus Kapabacteria bacterium]